MKKITLGDVAFESKNTFQGDRNNVPVVGLEHLNPGEVKLSRWDSDSENTFTKAFHKGDVLFGRRRAYLKKATIAPFDGICSGDITVISAKEKKVQPELLPFIIQSERFFAYAVKGSAGSLSPRVKWEHLKNYEFELPPIEEQRKLADLLWAAYELKESYKKLLAATDEMVKAKFIEMFGDLDNPKYELRKLQDIVYGKGVYGALFAATSFDGKTRYIRITDINEDASLNDDIVSPSEYDIKYKLLENDFLFARTGATVGKTYLHKTGDAIYAGYLIKYRFNPSIIMPEFVLCFTHSSSYWDWIKKTQQIGAQPNISAKVYDTMSVICPPLHNQSQFVEFVKQADASKVELNRAIAKLEQVMKSLLP